MIQEDKQQEDAAVLSDEAILHHLQQHPDFFIRHAHKVEMIQVPHPVRGSVSLVEWHLGRLRHRISSLEEYMAHLMSLATVNEDLFCRLLALQQNLSSSTSLQDLLDRLHRWARDLGLAGANIRLFTDRWKLGAPSCFHHLGLNRQLFEPIRIQRLGRQKHYLGRLNGPELLMLLPQAKAIGSVAISLMGEFSDLGVIIFSSRDSQHYQPDQGTRLLDELARLLPSLLERWIERS